MFSGEIILYNIFYEVFTVCTSIVAETHEGKLVIQHPNSIILPTASHMVTSSMVTFRIQYSSSILRRVYIQLKDCSRLFTDALIEIAAKVHSLI